MRLILPVPPSWNASYRQGKGRWYTPEKILTFRAQVMVAGRNAKVQKFPRETLVAVHLWWYRGRQSGDIDKRVSVCLDALQNVWFCDDAQVTEIHCWRLEDKINPRLEVSVYPYVGEAVA